MLLITWTSNAWLTDRKAEEMVVALLLGHGRIQDNEDLK